MCACTMSSKGNELQHVLLPLLNAWYEKENLRGFPFPWEKSSDLTSFSLSGLLDASELCLWVTCSPSMHSKHSLIILDQLINQSRAYFGCLIKCMPQQNPPNLSSMIHYFHIRLLKSSSKKSIIYLAEKQNIAMSIFLHIVKL